MSQSEVPCVVLTLKLKHSTAIPPNPHERTLNKDFETRYGQVHLREDASQAAARIVRRRYRRAVVPSFVATSFSWNWNPAFLPYIP